MLALFRTSDDERSARDGSRRRRAQTVGEAAMTFEGGVFRQITQLRQVTRLIGAKAPVFAEANPELLAGLGRVDRFLCELADLLPPKLVIAANSAPVGASGAGIFPSPSEGAPDEIYGSVPGVESTTYPPRFWRISKSGYSPVLDQYSAVAQHRLAGTADRVRDSYELAAMLDREFGPRTDTHEARASIQALQRAALAAEASQLHAAAAHAEACAALASAQGLTKQAAEQRAAAEGFRERAQICDVESSQ